MSRSRSKKYKPKGITPQTNSSPKAISSKPQVVIPSKKSKITELAQKPSYIIITLLISIFGAFGGISGILQMAAYLNDKPGFVFHFTTISVGTANPIKQDEEVTSIIISGIVENDGSKTLNINDDGFSLKILKPDGTIVKARKIMFPKNIVAVGKDSVLTDYKDTKDLLTVFKIPPLETISGSVYFFTTESRQSIQNNGNLFIFYCTDLSGKEYSSQKTFAGGQDQHINRIYPQTGVKIFEKNDSSFIKKP